MTPDSMFASGYAPGGPSVKDYTFDPSKYAAAPPAFIAPSFQRVPIFSQQGGTCVGNSIAGAFTHLQFQETGEVYHFNGEELNARVTHREGEATSFRPVMDDVLKSGVLYSRGNEEGLFLPAGYANVDYKNPEAIREAMCLPRTMCVFATHLPDGWDKDPRSFAPANPDPNAGWLHAMLLVGYQPEGVIVQNQYGSNWGDGGHVRLSWDYVTAHFVEVMAITDQDDVAGGYVKTYEFPDATTERAVKHKDTKTRKRPAVYLVKEDRRIWIKDIWEAKRFGVNLAAVEQLADTDLVWSLPVSGPDAPESLR